MLKLRFNQQGDTLVEVLIAIAIVSLILTTAYVISNRNVNSIQDNQERLQAQHLVAGQIENLRAAQGLPAGDTCFAADGSPANGASCVRTGVAGSGATHNMSIQGPTANVYTVKAVWQGINGNQTNNVTMYYRLD